MFTLIQRGNDRHVGLRFDICCSVGMIAVLLEKGTEFTPTELSHFFSFSPVGLKTDRPPKTGRSASWPVRPPIHWSMITRTIQNQIRIRVVSAWSWFWAVYAHLYYATCSPMIATGTNGALLGQRSTRTHSMQNCGGVTVLIQSYVPLGLWYFQYKNMNSWKIVNLFN